MSLGSRISNFFSSLSPEQDRPNKPSSVRVARDDPAVTGTEVPFRPVLEGQENPFEARRPPYLHVRSFLPGKETICLFLMMDKGRTDPVLMQSAW